MLLRIGKIVDNSMLKAADFVEYAEHLGIHADIVTQGDYVFICLEGVLHYFCFQTESHYRPII